MVCPSKNLDFSKIFFTRRILPNQAKSWKWVLFKTLLCQPRWFSMNVWYTIWKYIYSAIIWTQNFFQNPEFIFFLIMDKRTPKRLYCYVLTSLWMNLLINNCKYYSKIFLAIYMKMIYIFMNNCKFCSANFLTKRYT